LLVPRVTTRHPDFFVLNTAQFVNATLNNNEVARAVHEFVGDYQDRLEGIASTGVGAPVPMPAVAGS